MSHFENVEIVHDFSALNRAADFELNRKDGHLLALDRRTRVYATLAKGAAAAGVILATGIAAAIMLWMLDLRAPPDPPKVREPEKAVEVPASIHEVEKKAAAVNEMINFTLFHAVPSDLAGYGDVTTGSRFASLADGRPQSEWCYIERPSDTGTAVRLDLAEAPTSDHDAGPVAWSDQALVEMGLSRVQATELSNKCRFMGTGPRPLNTADTASNGQGEFLTFNGDITEGFARTVRALFADHPAARGLRIESAGGLMEEALEVGRWLRSQGKATLVTGECNSACVLVFAGGTERVAHSSARFGLHRAFFGTDDAVTGAEAQAAIGELLVYYMEGGIDPALLVPELTTAYEDITILDARKAIAVGLATRIAVIGEG